MTADFQRLQMTVKDSLYQLIQKHGNIRQGSQEPTDGPLDTAETSDRWNNYNTMCRSGVQVRLTVTSIENF